MGIEAPSRDLRHPRRVLMTADTVGGVWQYAMELCRGLVRHGDEVALATMGRDPDREQRREAEAIDGLALYPSRYRLLWMDDPWRDVERAGEWLQGLETALRPDVVHLNDLGHGALPWRTPVLLVVHSCVLSWWQAVHGSGAPAMWTRYADAVRRSVHAADLVVAPTRAMLQAIGRHYGAPCAARVIANGRRDPGAGTRREPFILCAGRLWDPAKNIQALATAARGLPWTVCIAGDQAGPDGQDVACIDNPPANVRLLGRLSPAQLQDWMWRASIYALPARYEPFGLSALEAALSGCALVLGDIPSLREVWGDAALYVPVDGPGALAHALQRLVEDEALRTHYAMQAGARARGYSPGRMVAAYRQAHADLAPMRAEATQRPHTVEAVP